MNKCCIVIPSYKEKLEGNEEKSFKQCLNVFNEKRDIKLLIPNNISTEYYDEFIIGYIKVSPQWMDSIKSYNKMCCNQEFYELFKDYDYILIYQTDCWVFEDRLDYFMKLGYDYYGAPWVHNNDKIGNGGLSLRKVSKMIDITSKYQFNGESVEGAEDTWFSITHGEEINTCPLDVAVNFSIENPARKYLEKVNKLPMGFHGKIAMSLFWDNDGTKFINYSNRILNKKKVEKPIRILFDNQIFDLQRFGGISRMYTDIKNTLNETSEFNVDISIEKTDNEYLKDSYPNGKGNNFAVSEERLNKGDFDIFYPTFFSPYFLNHIGNKPYVMSVHDMIPEIYSEYFSSNDLQIIGKREMVKHAAAIEVPSECTKKDLVRILGVNENKIHVIGRALNPRFGSKIYTSNVMGFDYILYVGQRNAYKRFDWFIKHIASFLKNHKDIHIVCTGKEFNEQEIKLITENNLWGRVHAIFADDVTMASLYKYAKFFVFSSEYEGFGLPVLESYKMDCIALLNDIEVFREITDGQGTFFTLKENESNLSEVAEKVVSLTNEEKNAILEKQYKILQKYSFEKYMNNIREIFNSVLSKKKNENLDLFICTHKNFEKQVSNPCYKVINAKDINGDVAENGLNGSFYSEILLYFNVAKNYPLKDYVGFCHYRKYFSFMDNVPDMDDFFKNYDALVVKPLKFNSTIKEQYETYHNVEDLEIVENIIANKFPEYYNAANFFFNKCTKMFPCNMFIMKKNDFIKYTEFIKGVLDEYVNIVGTDIEKRIEENKDKYLKNLEEYPQNKEPWYQYRIGGYLAERLTNVFILEHFKRVGICEMIETEKKY